MSNQTEDTPLNRFVAFWWALAVFLSFGILTVVVAGSRSCSGGSGMEGYDALVIKEREAKLTTVLEAQAEAMAGSAMPIDEAIKTAAAELAQTEPEATELPVPGTAAAMAAVPPAPVEEEVEVEATEVEVKEGEGGSE
ncbi:MAG: hypothetical protein AAF591_10055 [Verrucomicrobiota bacterium]